MGKRAAYDNILHQNGGPHKRTRYINDNSNGGDPASDCDDSPKPEFQLSKEIVNGAIITDLLKNKWRIGKPVGKGSFGEIFLASDDISTPVNSENAKYVAKIEPHSNGPLFVEIHCLINTARSTEENPLPPGMPEFIGCGSRYFNKSRYRFLILPRYDCDLHSIIKNRKVDQKSILVLAVQILEVLQHLHDKGYCHSDIKAENLMIGKCTYRKEKKQENNLSDCDLSAQSDDEDDDYCDEDDEESEIEIKTPVAPRRKPYVQYSGSNPVRSCRLEKRSSTYQEMVKSHYLRPTKKINYSEFFTDETSKNGDDEFTLDDYINRSRMSNGRRETNQNKLVTENRIFLIDFGLASKFVDAKNVHRPFCMDQRRAHDGTLEFTSRDAHMGAHSRRSDLECLGYNLIYWSQGYLPWKDNAAQQLPEKVHGMKEYLMADVTEMLKVIYGKSVPKYLGVFMEYVGKLAYDERPDYKKCKRIFQREFERLGYKESEMVLNLADLKKKPIDNKAEIENNNLCESKNLKSIMKNLGVLLPFRESNSNRVSPKNLRSKSEKTLNKKRKKLSWPEILSQDPDQIARERAEKEFEREQAADTPVTKYIGKPTYAILEIENRLKFKDRLDMCPPDDEHEIPIKGYTKQMMEILKKRQSAQWNNSQQEQKPQSIEKPVVRVTRPRAKSGLRTMITPTKRGREYNHDLTQRRTKRSHKNSGDFTTDESSCSSLNSVASTNLTNKKSQYSTATSTNSSLRGGVSRSSSCTSSMSEDDGRADDECDDSNDDVVFRSSKRKQHTNKVKSRNYQKNTKKNTTKTTRKELPNFKLKKVNSNCWRCTTRD